VIYAWPLRNIFFAWSLQIFYLCSICGCWEFSVVCLVFTFNIFGLSTFLVSVYLFYCILNDTFCSLYVCNMMFLFFPVICKYPPCALFVAAGNFLFPWFGQIFNLCLMCGCWDFSAVSVVFTANKCLLNIFLVSTKPISCDFNDTFCALCVCNMRLVLIF
jgi:hypothetical protein